MEKDPNRSCRTMNRRFDLTGNEVSRIGKHHAVSSVIQIGNYGNGPGFKCLLVAFLICYLGKPLGWMLIFFEDQIKSLLSKVRSIR